ncbi:MAG: hypothetical protein PHO37_08395 [Kiritimatiellae bacterium]|nr:hypothetical protein [Kiritimatiellia bacterium]
MFVLPIGKGLNPRRARSKKCARKKVVPLARGQRSSDFQSDMAVWKPELLRPDTSPVDDSGDDAGGRFPGAEFSIVRQHRRTASSTDAALPAAFRNRLVKGAPRGVAAAL